MARREGGRNDCLRVPFYDGEEVNGALMLQYDSCIFYRVRVVTQSRSQASREDVYEYSML